MIRTVIFDIDNTLYDYDLGHEAAMNALLCYCKDYLGLKKKDARQYIKEANDEQIVRTGVQNGSVHNRLIRYQIILERLGLPLFPHALNMFDLYWNTLLDTCVPEEGLLKFLRALKAKDIKLGIGSNMTAIIQFEKIEQLGLGNFFDFIVTSEEVNIDKPDPRFFELCVQKAGCRSSECAFIGDSYEHDVAGPEAVGMRGILYTRGKDIRKQSCRKIRSYSEADVDKILA